MCTSDVNSGNYLSCTYANSNYHVLVAKRFIHVIIFPPFLTRLGKDKSVFITKEDYDNPQATEVVVNQEEYGIILPSGEINWDCPCLGGMPQGPCGEEFKAAFSCFHYSTEENKGSDCIPQFRSMQECFQKHPDVYPPDEEEEEGDGQGEGKSEKEEAVLSQEQQDLKESSEKEKTEFVESMKEHSKRST